MSRENYPLSRKTNIVIQEFDKEILIYDLSENKAFCLNQTSAMIWQECDGTKSIAEISKMLSKKLKSNVSEEIVWLALNQLTTDKLLENSEKITTPFDGLNRREIVKRIGFASMIALPIISTVIAPSAAHALSEVCSCSSSGLSRLPGCPCNQNSLCCSNVCGAGGTVCTVSSGNAPGSASCCPVVACGPANSVNPPGCSCLGNANCTSGTCLAGNICSI